MKNTLDPCGCSGSRTNITAGGEFPTNPRIGDIHIDNNGTVWRWNGISWIDNGTIQIQAGLPYFGDPSPSDVPSPSEGDGFWIVTEPGVYTNFGGVELEVGQFMGVISRTGGVYSIKPSTIDLSGYATVASVDARVQYTDIKTEPIQQPNIFPSGGTIVSGSLINSSGSVQAATGWKRFWFNYTPYQGKYINMGGMPYLVYWAFLDDNNQLVGTAGNSTGGFGSLAANGTQRRRATLATATRFSITIRNATGTDADFENLYIREDASEIVVALTKNGVDLPLKGGLDVSQQGGPNIDTKDITFIGASVIDNGDGSVDVEIPQPEPLPTDATFDSVVTAAFETSVFSANLPEGAGSPPVGVQIGDAWIDTTNDTIKVRRS